MFKNNLPYIQVGQHIGFVDTGGGKTFRFRNNKKKSKFQFVEHADLKYHPKHVDLFVARDFLRTKIVRFNYRDNILRFVRSVPRGATQVPSVFKNGFFHVKGSINGKTYMFLVDTGATLCRKKRNSAISFLDGALFDALADIVTLHYDDDGSGATTLKLTLFGQTRKIRFLRRDKDVFHRYMSKVTGVKHVGALGGNALKYFDTILDYHNKNMYLMHKK
jgi:hypothetical protein